MLDDYTPLRHLTPETLDGELRKLDRRVKVYVTHVKPKWRPQIRKQLQKIHSPRLELLEQKKTYRF